MYTATVEENGKEEDYEVVVVDNRKFYKKKETAGPVQRRRRISERIRDPRYRAVDNYRRLRMLIQQSEKADLDEITESYRQAIVACTEILHKEAGMHPSSVYKYFNLKECGFAKDDFMVEEETEEADED